MPSLARVLAGAYALVVLTGGCTSSSHQIGKSSATSGAVAPKRYVCHYTTTPVAIDGRLDDHAWNAAAWTDRFVDIEGSARPRPRFETRAKLAWDDEYLYIAAALEEPHIWATLTEHDQIVFRDNDFEVFIDPNGDTCEYYEVEVNAFNTIFDLFLVRTYNAGGPALHGWDLKGLRTAVHIDGTLNQPSDVDTGWSVELALPWAALAEAAGTPAPPQAGATWRMNFSRVEWQHRVFDGRYQKLPDTKEDNWVWSPQGKINMHLPERWGDVEFAR
ncbi:MAG: carbohydrate-binding family 9-like protein [Planctomycetes bacterium]|nr:carbohydrate-binding family 9-like protein [Planctomycetota bacterium]